MVGVQSEQDIQRPLGDGVHFITLAGKTEHRVQQVAGIAPGRRGGKSGSPMLCLAGGGDGRHLGDQPAGGDHAVLVIADVEAVVEKADSELTTAAIIAIGWASWLAVAGTAAGFRESGCAGNSFQKPAFFSVRQPP